MAPFPRRPTHDALHLGSGDFRSASASVTAIPPVAGRIYPSSQGGFPAPSNRPIARHAATPLPPNSLSPVAMGAAGAMGTGPQPIQREMIVVRTRPSFRLGMSIVLAGAILGGSIGVAMRARQDASEAAFAARVAANPTSPPLPVALGAGGLSAGALSPAVGPQTFAPAAYAGAVAPTSSPVERDKKEPRERRTQHVVAKPAVVAHPTHSPKAGPAKKDSSKDKDDEGWTIASAGDSSPPPPPATRDGRDPKIDGPKADAKDRSDRSDARESREVKGGSKKAATTGKSPDDASAVLKAAMGATENTL